MIHVVVRSITVGNIFQCHPCDEFDDAGIARLEHPVDLLILLLKLSNKRIDDDLYRIKHCSLHAERLPCGAATRVKLRPLGLGVYSTELLMGRVSAAPSRATVSARRASRELL